MRRGAKPAKAKVEAKLPVARKSPKDEGSRVHDLEKRLAEALKRETEAQEQQAATSEILRVISSSPTELQRGLDAVAESATRLCAAYDAVILRRDGDVLQLLAHHGPIASPRRPVAVNRGTVSGRAVLDRQPTHVADVQTETREFPEGVKLAQEGGFHTILSVPLLREGVAIGTINLRRTEVRPFTDKQIKLLETFADQAVIAIENVRLFKELEARNRDLTATSEILQVISSSPTDTQPVFDIIAANAARLCAARDAQVLRVEADVLRLVSAYGSPSMPPVRTISRGHAVGRAVIDRQTIHVRDMAQAVTEFPETSAPQHGVESVLAVPLLREDVAVGVIRVSRTQIQPFTEQQIALLQTFADQAVIAIENVRLFTELQARNRDLTEALEQQTATSEVLQVISSSPTDVQPVFDAIVRSAARLCEATFAALHRFDGQMLSFEAHHGMTEPEVEESQRRFPHPPTRDTAVGRAILDRQIAHLHDIRNDPEYRVTAGQMTFRTVLAVPLLKEGNPIGAMGLWRREVQPFTDSQIQLVKTFADQAVIAIENVRLFTETKEALERQTATSEVLRAISRAQADAQPVFEIIAASALRLCSASYSSVCLYDGEQIQLAALHNVNPEGAEALRSAFPLRAEEDNLVGRAIRSRAVVQIPDVLADPTYGLKRELKAMGFRSLLGVPLLRNGEPIGTVNIGRVAPGPFADNQVELLRTFADQAVIAIENVRLFTELQARNRDLTRALDQQTSTSEILRAISSAHTDAQPVFDTIVQSAARLCNAANAAVFRVEGGMLYHPANYGGALEPLTSARARFPRPVGMDTAPGQAILARSAIQIPDVEDPSVTAPVREAGHVLGFRSCVAVPMLSAGEAVGAIVVTRRPPGLFSDAEVELLKTFTDQAVIAIENVRLFKELGARTADLTRSVEQLTALGEVGRAVSSTLDLETVLTTIVSRAVQLSGLDGGVVFEYDEAAEEFVQRAAAETGGVLAQARRGVRHRKGEGALGRTALTLEPVQVPDITVPGAYDSRVRENLIESGIRAILAVPMVHQGRLIGCLGVTRNRPGDFPAGTIELLRTFATQSALAIQNARLFREIADKSHQLEVASRHKSEFLANMSHELRTPLNAIIGFSEVLAEGMFGEVNEKQTEYLRDILESGQHLLSLINDILDLSKIEAGRMELELTDFDLPQAILNALTLVRERAGRRGIALHQAVDERLGQIRGDERKIKQVLLNLLSNALKFTSEGGRVDVRAGIVDGMVEISVTDTGVGIAPEDQEAVFEEFRQVGTASKKVEGTGLGLALSRKFIELHGGRIWVKSQVRLGSTFTFTLPLTVAV
jgi:GAF domain-containing protein